MPSFICCLHATHAGNIQKAQPSAFRNSIKFLSLCSRLFLCDPIVMHWSWNQSPAVHAASPWFQSVCIRERVCVCVCSVTQQQRQANKQREKYEKLRACIQQGGRAGGRAHGSGVGESWGASAGCEGPGEDYTDRYCLNTELGNTTSWYSCTQVQHRG